MNESGSATGVILIRVWSEGGEARLRARVAMTLDVVARATEWRIAADDEEITRIVTDFLDRFRAEHARRRDGQVTRSE